MPEPKVYREKIENLRPLGEENSNAGTERGQYIIEESMDRIGAWRSITATADNVIPAGNHALDAYAAQGHDEVLVVETDGDTLVVVKRTDVSSDDPRAKEYQVLDNRSSEVGLKWNAEVMKDLEQQGIPLEDWFTEKELTDLFRELPGAVGGNEIVKVDNAAELQKKWQTALGQVWIIDSKTVTGRSHRLLCGDACNPDDVARLLDGLEPRLMVTDPPYGVEYEPTWRHDTGLNRSQRTKEVANDDRADWREAWALSPAKVAYVWHAGRFASTVQDSLEACGFEIRSQIIWHKTRFAISRGHYHWQHEPCWYAVKKGNDASWLGDRKQTTIWEIPVLDDVDMKSHSTQKPTECMARPMKNHAGDVYDPFGGSGTTIVAAEMNERICFMMELDPAFTALILERLTLLGLAPRLDPPRI